MLVDLWGLGWLAEDHRAVASVAFYRDTNGNGTLEEFRVVND
jgi:hypothetical protein